MTYSLVGRDPESGEIGVAVQSQAFNCGAAVPWARPGVGAVATQASTDRRYGWRGLELLAAGTSPESALNQLREGDEYVEVRQVGIMAADGRSAQWTGSECVPDAGDAHGEDWIAQANMVFSSRVWLAMGEAFEATTACLAERLLAALEAAEREGGDWRGRGGAANVHLPIVRRIERRPSGRVSGDAAACPTHTCVDSRLRMLSTAAISRRLARCSQT